MPRPYALLRAGFPYVKTVGMRRVTSFPTDIALGSEGRIYVLCRTDIAADVRIINLDDESLGTIGKLGTDDGDLQWPVSIIVDSAEELLISDEALHRVSRFNRDGEFLGKWGEQGDGDGQLNGPAGMAFDADENVYVVDSLTHRVQKFTRDGKFLLGWGGFGTGEGELNYPWGVAVDEVGDVYISDWRNDRVQKFTAEGEFIFAFGGSGSGDGEFDHPAGLCVDKDGDIYVADTLNNRIQVFNAEAEYVTKFIGDATLSKSGRTYLMANALPMRLREMAKLEEQKLLRKPKSVVVDDDGLMYVPDYGSYRVQVYQKEAVPLDESQIFPPLRSPTLATT
jgi:DNA-binding beta-propeller fold protein YncE